MPQPNPSDKLQSHPLLVSSTVGVWDVLCEGKCKHKSAEECVASTHIVFPYAGVFVKHVGREESVADANQVIFLNDDEPYRISHPVEGGDSVLSISLSTDTLLEAAPRDYLAPRGRAAFNRSRLGVDTSSQVLAAYLRHRLDRGNIETLEAETLTLSLVLRALDKRTTHAAAGSSGRQKLADRAKLMLSSDVARRWTLAEIAAGVGVSPVYLTQVFQHVEGIPLYQYQLRLRLARALALLGRDIDLSRLALDLGFSSHSHFSAAFRRAHGKSPRDFKNSMMES